MQREVRQDEVDRPLAALCGRGLVAHEDVVPTQLLDETADLADERARHDVPHTNGAILVGGPQVPVRVGGGRDGKSEGGNGRGGGGVGKGAGGGAERVPQDDGAVLESESEHQLRLEGPSRRLGRRVCRRSAVALPPLLAALAVRLCAVRLAVLRRRSGDPAPRERLDAGLIGLVVVCVQIGVARPARHALAVEVVHAQGVGVGCSVQVSIVARPTGAGAAGGREGREGGCDGRRVDGRRARRRGGLGLLAHGF